VLRSELFGNREGLEGLDLPVRRSDHWGIGAPQNMIGTEAAFAPAWMLASAVNMGSPSRRGFTAHNASQL
jgi:hypothetical protein